MVTTTNGLIIRVQRVVLFITCELWAEKPGCPIEFWCFHSLFCCFKEEEGQELRLREWCGCVKEMEMLICVCRRREGEGEGEGEGESCCCCCRGGGFLGEREKKGGFICAWRGQAAAKMEDVDEEKIKEFGWRGGEKKVKNKW
jgi:hypothetical protein